MKKPNAIPGKSREPLARLKNGEQSVMKGKRLTWVKGERGNLDESSRKILAAGRKPNAQPSGGGGGWKEMNEKMASNRAKAITTASRTQSKIEEGDINGGIASGHSGTSIFDPVLCELAYRWFCPPSGKVLDPFAGGSVRGIVAGKLGRAYVGVDLSERQISANREQAQHLCKAPALMPKWIVGDSAKLDSLKVGIGFDFIFSCPPYADLEVYSEDERDLSTMAYADFRSSYAGIINHAVALLNPDRFACFVVGDARDRDGFYYGLPWHTVEAFQAAGMALYNEAVLVTAAGSLPIRTRKQFESTRKFGKTHQNVLVFVKGDARAATQAVGDVEFGEAPVVDGGDPASQFGIIM